MNFAPMVLNIGGFKINALDHAAVVNLGPSEHIDIYVSYKRNQGIGEQNGDLSPMFLPVSWVSDADWQDSNSIKNSII